jgi:methionyl-tRNA synthetase
MAYLKPVVPDMVAAAEVFLQSGDLLWVTELQPLLSHKINEFTPLMTRVDNDKIAAIVAASTATLEKTPTQVTAPAPKTNPVTSVKLDTAIADTIDFESFAKIDLRVGEIINAEEVEGSDKLLKLTLNIGTETRTIFSGIKTAYSPDALIGRLTLVIVNLAPRKMRFGISEGMVLAAGPGGQDIWLLSPDAGAYAGLRVS